MDTQLSKSFADLADSILSGSAPLEEFFRNISAQASAAADTIAQARAAFQADAVKLTTLLATFGKLAESHKHIREVVAFVEEDRFALENAGHGDMLDVIRDPDVPLEKYIVTLEKLARIALTHNSSSEDF